VLNNIRSKGKNIVEIIDTYLEGDHKKGIAFFAKYDDLVLQLKNTIGESIYSGPGESSGYHGPQPIGSSVYGYAQNISWWEVGNEQIVLALTSHDGGSLYYIQLALYFLPVSSILSKENSALRKFEIEKHIAIYRQETEAFIESQDKAFWKLLGEEIGTEKCSVENCERKCVLQSILCRVHHFERYHRKPCPYS